MSSYQSPPGWTRQVTSAVPHMGYLLDPSSSSQTSFGCSLKALCLSYVVAPKTAHWTQDEAAPVSEEWNNHLPQLAVLGVSACFICKECLLSIHKDDTGSKINKPKKYWCADIFHPHKHTPSCPALGSSSCRRHGCSSFVLLLVLCQHTHHSGDALKMSPHPDVGSLQAAPALPDSCQVQAAPDDPWRAALLGCNRNLLAFSVKTEFFPIIQVLADILSSSKGAVLEKTTKNGNSSIQNQPPPPNTSAFWFLKQELKTNCLKHILDFNSDLKKIVCYQLRFINHEAIFSVNSMQ